MMITFFPLPDAALAFCTSAKRRAGAVATPVSKARLAMTGAFPSVETAPDTPPSALALQHWRIERAGTRDAGTADRESCLFGTAASPAAASIGDAVTVIIAAASLRRASRSGCETET